MAYVAMFVGKIDPTWKALMALGTAVLFGASMGMFFVGFTGLPAQVEMNTEHAIDGHPATVLMAVEKGDSTINARLDRILCLMVTPDSIEHIATEVICT